MPNLLQIKSLREKYISHSVITTKDIILLSENFNKSKIEIKNQFIKNKGDQDLIEYFENQKSAEVVLLFIDITNFSSGCSAYSNEQLSNYLDDYYDIVIKTIYHHGGEIEKIIGDGIICVFGEPFLNENLQCLFEKADACAKDLIIELKETDKEVKIALHHGKIMYYKNKSESYTEYTMIGKPITELFRLESIAENNSISFFYVSPYHNMNCSEDGVFKYSRKNVHSYWRKSDSRNVDLKGVTWKLVVDYNCSFKTS